jgi:hypothetical protein
MLTLDRDLLILEPRLFNDLGWLSQRLHRATNATMQSGGVGITDASGPFAGLGIGAGHILLINELPVEIAEITSATEATISLIRANPADAPIPARNLSGTVTIECFTFAPQIAIVHERIIRSLGLGVGPTIEGGPLAEDRITNPMDVSRVIALGALHLIFAAATPMVLGGGDSSGVRSKADAYRDRFASARRALAAEIDLDGDGIADATRRVSLINLVRA